MDMIIAKVMQRAREMKRENHSLRYGQALFNALGILDADIANEIRGDRGRSVLRRYAGGDVLLEAREQVGS